MQYNKSFYEKYGLKVTRDALKQPEGEPPIHVMQRLHDTVKLGGAVSPKMIDELEHYVAQYPTAGALKNYLYIAYSNANQKQKATDTLNLTVEQHPDYIFGHLNLASQYIEKRLYDSAAAVLKEPYHIQNLCKGEFIHESMLKSYYSMVILTEIGRKNIKKAENAHRILFDYNPEDALTQNLATMLMIARFSGSQLFQKAPTERKVPIISKPIKSHFLSIQGKPVFNHPEIHLLYEYSLENIPKSVIQSILSLPRPTLIQDLEYAFLDSILRFGYFREYEWAADSCNFVVHALYLLTELRSYSSLPVILDFLRQDEGFINYWMGDAIEKYFDTPVYILAENQLDILKQFAFEENISPWHRALACRVVAQVALKQPTRREESLQWFHETIQYHLDNPNNNDLIDSSFLSSLIAKLMRFSAVELTEDIKKLFATGWIQDRFCGNLEQVLEDIQKPIDPYRNDPLPTDIYELYSGEYEKRRDRSLIVPDKKFEEKLNDPYELFLLKNMVASLKSKDKDDNALPNNDPDEEGYDEEGKGHWAPPQQSIKRIETKVGRNDFCPCGSGKKYKKCHGK
jgi:tetratricopeptide (TPR) repeat protein